MIATSAACAPYVDEDPTHRDPHPWHESSGTYDVDEATVVRPLPELAASCALAPRPSPRHGPEALETLPLPVGLDEAMFPVGARPAGAAQTRIAIVRVARELAVHYRAAYRCTLQTDVASVERMQRHLLAHADEVLAGRADPRALAPDIARHGVVLGEILVRAVGAAWKDLSGTHPGAWQLFVPPATIVSPVARVHRFLLRRSSEQDLVGYFLELARVEGTGS
jgi:hypothetical protein